VVLHQEETAAVRNMHVEDGILMVTRTRRHIPDYEVASEAADGRRYRVREVIEVERWDEDDSGARFAQYEVRIAWLDTAERDVLRVGRGDFAHTVGTAAAAAFPGVH
jgi:hypothetical protein